TGLVRASAKDRHPRRPLSLHDALPICRLHPHTGRAHVVGITGPPGAGKSTLTDRVTARLRAAGHRVGIVAVDPTSPFSGGADAEDRKSTRRNSSHQIISYAVHCSKKKK